MDISDKETKRLELQYYLDSKKTQPERNKLGQFATPRYLALEMLRFVESIMPKEDKILFLDPAIGTGAFYSALLSVFTDARIEKAVGFEIDPHYGIPAIELWNDTNLSITLGDFTRVSPPNKQDRFNLIICNPPYVRHHHLGTNEKKRLGELTAKLLGSRISGLTGLYCYFLLLCHEWMADDGIAGWLIPSEFMDVNYGKPIKKYLLEQVTLLRIHRFDPSEVQFDDALVSSTIVLFRKSNPLSGRTAELSFGGSLIEPKTLKVVSTDELSTESKWARFSARREHRESSHIKLSDLFSIKRGLATGDNRFFILTEAQIRENDLPIEFFKPIIPSSRFLKSDEILTNEFGIPLVETPLFLLDCRLGEDEIKKKYPSLWKYLEKGKKQGIHEKYLCKHRSPWYSQETREPAPILCTYMGRKDGRSGNDKPFRFILNHSKATASNTYLMLYPKPFLSKLLESSPNLIHELWNALGSIASESLIQNGRVYGGGLHKLEPKELANIPADSVARYLPDKSFTYYKQMSFL